MVGFRIMFCLQEKINMLKPMSITHVFLSFFLFVCFFHWVENQRGKELKCDLSKLSLKTSYEGI